MDTHNAPHLNPLCAGMRAPSAQQPATGAGSQLFALDAQGHSRTLDCPAGSEIQVLSGCIWLTREGRPDDHFLRAGQFMWLPAAARLHLSAEGREPARLQISLP